VNGAVLNALQERSEAVIRRGLIEYDKVVDTPEIVELKAQIRSLEKLEDPDIAPALQKKNDRLMGLIAEQQKLGQNYLIRIEKLIQYGKDPNFWLLATEQELIVLYLEFVESVTCWIPDKRIEIKLRV
jgi:plasmid maintenance system antidote protein VapI